MVQGIGADDLITLGCRGIGAGIIITDTGTTVIIAIITGGGGNARKEGLFSEP